MSSSVSEQRNEMEVLAEAAFWITDMVKGLTGSFTVEEDGWGSGDAERCVKEINHCLNVLREHGFKDDKKAAEFAPFTHNVNVGAFVKKIGGRKFWVTLQLTSRFGIHAEFKSWDKKPWS